MLADFYKIDAFNQFEDSLVITQNNGRDKHLRLTLQRGLLCICLPQDQVFINKSLQLIFKPYRFRFEKTLKIGMTRKLCGIRRPVRLVCFHQVIP